MSFLFAFVLIFIAIIVFQITLKLKVFFNIKNNIGNLELKLFNIKVLSYKLSIKHRCLVLTNKRGKNKYMPIEFSQESIQNYADFESILFRKIYFKKFSLFFNFGIKHNAFASAMVCGYVDILTKILYCILKTKKSEVKLKLKIYPSFESNVIKFQIKAKISLSLFDLFWSFVEAVITKHLKSKKQKEFEYAR